MQGTDSDGTDERWNLRTVLGIEARPGDWYWSVQYFHDQVQGGPALVWDRRSRMVSLRLNRTFNNERLAFTSFSVLDLDYDDLAVRAALSYQIDDKTTVEVGGTAYADGGDKAGLFGSYAGRESVFAKLGRQF